MKVLMVLGPPREEKFMSRTGCRKKGLGRGGEGRTRIYLLLKSSHQSSASPSTTGPWLFVSLTLQ